MINDTACFQKYAYNFAQKGDVSQELLWPAGDYHCPGPVMQQVGIN